MGQADDRVNWIYYSSVGRTSDLMVSVDVKHHVYVGSNVRRDTDCAGSIPWCVRALFVDCFVLFCF